MQLSDTLGEMLNAEQVDKNRVGLVLIGDLELSEALVDVERVPERIDPLECERDAAST